MSRTLIDISILLNILGFGQGMFLCFSLWKSRKVKSENIYLVYLFIAISVIILNAIFRLSYYIDALWFFEMFSNSFLLVIAPSIFLFVKIKSKQAHPQNPKWVHYLPFLFYFSFNLVSLVYLETKQSTTEIIDNIAYLIFNLQFIVYFVLSLFILGKIKPLPDPLKWIRIAIWLIIVPWLLQLGFLFAENIFGVVIPDFLSLNLSLIFGICTFFLSYVHTTGKVGFAKKEKYEDSRISPNELSRNLNIIKSIIKKEKLFLDKEMSLKKISEKTQLSPRDVSLSINQGMQQNFVDFINSYRIESFKQIIRQESSSNYTLVAIAENCGFKSSSTFYAAFKKQMGITPKQYKDNLDSNP